MYLLISSFKVVQYSSSKPWAYLRLDISYHAAHKAYRLIIVNERKCVLSLP